MRHVLGGRPVLMIALSVLALFEIVPRFSQLAQAQALAAASVTSVYGDVLDARNKTIKTVVPNDLPPVAGALVSLPDLGRTVRTDARGQFLISNVTLPLIPQGAAYAKTRVRASAPGFGDWQLDGVPLYVSGDRTRVYIELTSSPHSAVYVPAGVDPLSWTP